MDQGGTEKRRKSELTAFNGECSFVTVLNSFQVLEIISQWSNMEN